MTAPSALSAALAAGLEQLPLTLPAEAPQKLLAYCALIEKWNRVYNLTAIRDPAQMLTHHILDSLAVLPALGELRYLADIGSGAGLPGLALAIACPEMQIVSIEKAAKKAAFQQQAKTLLQLDNVRIENCRVEDLRLTPAPEAVIARAFASLRNFVDSTAALLDEKGVFLAMKGAYPEEEIRDLPPAVRLRDSVQLNVPGLAAERHLLILESVHG